MLHTGQDANFMQEWQQLHGLMAELSLAPELCCLG